MSAGEKGESPPPMTVEEATRIAAHRTLGELYETRAKSPEGTWADAREAIENLMLAGEPARAWPLVESYVRALSAKGLRDEAVGLLARCEERGLTGDLLARSILLRHDLRASGGATVDDLAAEVGRALSVAETDATRGLAVHRLGRLATEQGNVAAAAGLLEQAEAYAVRAFGEGHVEQAAALQDLGAVLASQGRFEEAEAALRRAVGYGETLVTEGAIPEPTLGTWLGNLATVLVALGRHAEAEELLRRALGMLEDEALRGPAYGALLKDLSDVVASRGEAEEAEVLAGKAVFAFEAALGPTHPMLAVSLAAHADRLRDLGQSLLAEGCLRRALSLYSEANGPKHPTSVELLAKLAQAEFAAGNPLALETAERALSLFDEVLGEDHAFVKENAPLLRSMMEMAAPEPTGAGPQSLFAFYEGEIGRGIRALEENDPARAIEVLLPIAEQAHDAGIIAVEGTAAGLLAQAFSLVGAGAPAVTCAQRAVDLAAQAGQHEAERRFRCCSTRSWATSRRRMASVRRVTLRRVPVRRVPVQRAAVRRLALRRVAVRRAAVQRAAVRRLALRKLAVQRAAVQRAAARKADRRTARGGQSGDRQSGDRQSGDGQSGDGQSGDRQIQRRGRPWGEVGAGPRWAIVRRGGVTCRRCGRRLCRRRTGPSG
ncbi:MAG: tetratricopeptide repeat protein [Polyangiaceae bacterium]